VKQKLLPLKELTDLIQALLFITEMMMEVEAAP
jgi:hypothetical protein